ncbi:MAG: histidine kinase [Saprospiraceae bacterium]|nr:histidine kinase [Saprospiraceae bacterium]
MRKKFTIVLLILFTANVMVCQDQCSCLDFYINKKNNESDSLISTKLLNSSSVICKAKGFEMKAYLLTDELKLDSAEIFLKKAEQLFKKTHCKDTVLLNTYKIWAQVNYSRADYPKAQEYSLKMVACAEAAGKYYDQAKGYTMIAQLFNQTNQAERGIVYIRKAIKLLPKLSEKEKYSIIYFISIRYLWYYQDTDIISALDTSEFYCKEYLTWSKNRKEKNRIYQAFNTLQGIAYERGEFGKALTLLDSSYQYMGENNNEIQLYYSDKADIMMELKKYEEAQKYAESALKFALMNKNPSYIADIYKLLESISVKKRDFKKAYEMCKMHHAINDSIRTVDKTEAVTELEKKYNQAKNESIIKDLDKKKQLYLLLALTGLFVVLAISFYLRQQKLKHKQDILLTEQRLNRARMNPHFFFNALTSLQKFALSDNDGKELASNLSKFSNLMRETLESTYKEYVTIEEEIDFLSEYLEVQKIRFPKTFSYDISANSKMEVDDILIPSMILQPFVENSIEHGFSGIDYSGHVDINFKVSGKEIIIEISDNGIGLLTSYKTDNEHISRASQIIKDRIYLLNIKLKTKAGFNIDNNKDGKGAVVKIHLPLLYKSNQHS